MFGSRQRAPRPVLLMIVLGVLLGVVGITATAQTVMVTVYATGSSLNAIIGSDLATIRGLVHESLDPAIVREPNPSPDELATLNRLVETLTSKGEILRAQLILPDGRILVSSEPSAVGATVPPSDAFSRVLTGTSPEIGIVDAEQAAAGPGDLGSPNLLREYLPLRQNGTVVLVAAIWRDAVPILTNLDDLRRDIVVVMITGAILVAVILFFVFRSAQGRLTRQTTALLEASQRDPLTGTLNHGALVGHLAMEIERARPGGMSIGVALVDLDGFRLLNDNHGHEAGDSALLGVAKFLTAALPPEFVAGRYGPDEFLVIAPPEAVERLQPAIEAARTALIGFELQFESTEPLPVSVSVGICDYPRHGSSVSVLLATAVRTLEDAKAGGGDSISVAGDETEADQGTAATFDVLQGLVFAVDTKDRYTKRHSEDVSRYAAFIAQRSGLDDATVETIRLSGLLHDVGKIGIPDQILRKPGRLTAEELEVIKQHVALGEMIVRDVPDTESVRAAIRHHHERWDGRGYLTGIAGEEIPLIARILAVADTFSAMTTTRPYRKALPVTEALARLGDAAGSQLDEALVKVFIEGLETVPDAPLPGEDIPSGILWTSLRRAA